VVQLYVKHLRSKVERPREELKGFQRITVQPNETKTVQNPLKAAALAWWTKNYRDSESRPSPFKVMIGIRRATSS